MQEELNIADTVSRAVDRITRRGRDAEFELSNGIVLKIKPVPPLLLQALNQEFVVPDPPVIFMEDKGRDEPNPNDPTYLKLLDKLAEDQQQAVYELLLGMGTEVVNVPEGYVGPENDEWIAQVEFAISLAGKTITIDRDNKIKRYICWLRYYAMETQSDYLLATNLSGMLAGIREGEIDEVVEFFRRLPERGADTERPTEIGSTNGNSPNRAARRSSSRTRGA